MNPAAVMVIVEGDRENRPLSVSLESLTLSRHIAGSLSAPLVVAALGPDGLAQEVACHHVDRVYRLGGEALNDCSTETVARALVRLAGEVRPRLVVMGETALSWDLAARVAFALDGCLISGCHSVTVESDELRFSKPIYSGHLTAVFAARSSVAVATLRSGQYDPARFPGEAHAQIVPVELCAEDSQFTVEVVERVREETDGVAMEAADVIVAGGRGLGGAQGFTLLAELAEVLGGAVGASRPAVDCGWAPHGTQIGQTGKTVAPSLYVAIGISGAMQHLTGMSGSQHVVAINADPRANIFRAADYGVIGRYEEVLPALTETLRALRETEATS